MGFACIGCDGDMLAVHTTTGLAAGLDRAVVMLLTCAMLQGLLTSCMLGCVMLC
jgi:hypothetical protein